MGHLHVSRPRINRYHDVIGLSEIMALTISRKLETQIGSTTLETRQSIYYKLLYAETHTLYNFLL